MKGIVFKSLLFLLLLFNSGILTASAINIDPATVSFNGYPCGTTFMAQQTVVMTYIAEDYMFSGNERNKYGYYIFEFVSADKKERFYEVQLTRDFLANAGEHSFSFRLPFKLPAKAGAYTVSYCRIALITSHAVGNLIRDYNSVRIDASTSSVIMNHLRQNRSYVTPLCTVNSTVEMSDKAVSPTIYLKLNSQVPTTIGIRQKDEFAFSWDLRNTKNDMNPLYRYRLYPDEDWSFWQADSFVNYYLINKGNHEFQVEARYSDGKNIKTTNVAKFSFNLEKSFLGKPIYKQVNDSVKWISYIDKTDTKRKTTDPAEIIEKVYDKSKALLIGVTNFKDSTLSILPYVKNDIDAVRKSFSLLGFETREPAAQTRDEILSSIRQSLDSLNKDDRLIIYISSHGFLDPLDKKKAFIATSDCSKQSPSRGISIEELHSLITATGVNGRHILLILDCCVAGMGIIDKAGGLSAVRTLATERGTHIMTAGLSDQNARMYPGLKMSVFTYFLTEGLTNKKADYTKDGIITLSELLLYVQYKVASYTDSEQVPVSGRFSGYGEPIFY